MTEIPRWSFSTYSFLKQFTPFFLWGKWHRNGQTFFFQMGWNHQLPSLKLTQPWKLMIGRRTFPLGWSIFRGYVSFPECRCLVGSQLRSIPWPVKVQYPVSTRDPDNMCSNYKRHLSAEEQQIGIRLRLGSLESPEMGGWEVNENNDDANWQPETPTRGKVSNMRLE